MAIMLYPVDAEGFCSVQVQNGDQDPNLDTACPVSPSKALQDVLNLDLYKGTLDLGTAGNMDIILQGHTRPGHCLARAHSKTYNLFFLGVLNIGITTLLCEGALEQITV